MRGVPPEVDAVGFAPIRSRGSGKSTALEGVDEGVATGPTENGVADRAAGAGVRGRAMFAAVVNDGFLFAPAAGVVAATRGGPLPAPATGALETSAVLGAAGFGGSEAIGLAAAPLLNGPPPDRWTVGAAAGLPPADNDEVGRSIDPLGRPGAGRAGDPSVVGLARLAGDALADGVTAEGGAGGGC